VVINWPTDDGLGGRVWAGKNIFGKSEKLEFYRKWSSYRVKIFNQNTWHLVSSNGHRTLRPTESGVAVEIFFSISIILYGIIQYTGIQYTVLYSTARKMPIWPTSGRDNELKFFCQILPIGSKFFFHLNPTADVIFILAPKQEIGRRTSPWPDRPAEPSWTHSDIN